MRLWQKGLAAVAATGTVVFFFFSVDVRPREEYVPEPIAISAADTTPLPPDAYGIPMSGYSMEQGKVRPGDTFGGLLTSRGVDMSSIQGLVELASDHFDVRKMRAGYPYAFIFKEDDTLHPDYFIYEADPVRYVVFRLRDGVSVHVGERAVKSTAHSIACLVTGALYNDLASVGGDPQLAMQLADVFAWTVDFYRIQKDDVFSVVYNERSVDGVPFGTPEIVGARYISGRTVRAAYRFAQDDGTEQYFDDEGRSLKKAFLQAPIKFSRISSGYSKRRMHPVQRVMKAHLGTDYAAPYGTPIQAVGDGIVEKAGRTGGNGNYVKIRHNGTYSTQYLHMRKVLVKQGAAVQQGQVIGEVGSTGLATGPHVCFRFWKNGVQVDHRKEEFPNTNPLAEELMPAFNAYREPIREELFAAEKVARGRVVNF
ncbi:MAG: peptidoglycan DD-metalloendopeptidase family protein [Flavobacteriales bacterium]|jgi:murein DD-endopeptidase MepM/ murein hydrolase activator NlpD|nr:peptidoglycan DD-metalloendopeptidase family protein [Flavobacteriales bacterium]MBK7113418.1 peptidoglycan DD-metalloendopeptidase family protein [Flavobacteriales bacterium]MBK7482579.1 peptidoglycan DD-metalloendopeptidase family protein [Flavobacteriales bacterium]MBK8530780.1 peptidoglycan DD-metalloendopeptidase family protein [Flavobacteriales bacterium]HQW07017.1 peptidoglycan DD-metalloendopeptidase family protein [Flavobacteriales bacterium]